MNKGISRRDALKQIGAIAGAAAVAPRLLTGCGGGGKITTIVTLMMENRSYDHYLGARAFEGKPGDGLAASMSNPDLAGLMHAVYHEDVDCIADPPHGWNPARVQLNGGVNDGFVKAYQQRHGEGAMPYPMGYFAREQLPVTWALADAYTSCDRWFSSVLGPTWPNRLYLHCAQSGGMIENKLPETGLYELPTIYQRLTDAGVPWRYYFTDVPFIAILKGLPQENMKRVPVEFFNDVAEGTLPPVVFIDPGFGLNDDHPPHHPLMGQQFIGSIYAALSNGPQWNEMMFVITYDEHGGFFDHVAPPLAADDRAAAGFDQLGFRVPTLVTGPWVKKGHVSSTVRDHTSVLKHIENMFGLEPLTARDAAANDLTDTLDADRLSGGDPAPPVQLAAVEISEDQLPQVCRYGPQVKPTEIEEAADAGIIPPELDARGDQADTLRVIAEVLDRYGAGGIRRGR